MSEAQVAEGEQAIALSGPQMGEVSGADVYKEPAKAMPTAAQVEAESEASSSETHENRVDKAQNNEQSTGEEHPDAHKIRSQVHYYFSDENLRTDLHLLRCCSGRDNVPVSISRISGFSKMRVFKKSVIVAALRKSEFLEVTDDGKNVRRKVPLEGPCLLDEDFVPAAKVKGNKKVKIDPRTNREIQHPVPLLPQGKKEYPPGMTKNMMKPTGFEDTYVEGPLRPEQAKEEEEMYDPGKPFVERIEIAIQRFKQRRRMHEMYSKIFNKWMKFGGVECAPRMFGGLSQQDMKDMTAEEIAVATATHSVPWDREDREKWVIDFVGVGEAFFSSYYPAHYGNSPTQVKIACQVLRSFYNYLLFHSVCDEHRDEILLARALCDKAEFELPQSYHAGNILPGAFNVAASTLFGGSHKDTYVGASGWYDELTEEEKKNLYDGGMRDEESRVTFKTGVSVYGTETQYKALNKLDSPNPKFVTSETTGLEVVAIHYSTDVVKEAYRIQNENWKRAIDLQPLGKLICKSCIFDDYSEYDLPPGKSPPGKHEGRDYEFWVEDDVLEECFVGLKVDARVLTLEGGIQILDSVREAFCSFYKWIPNELWELNKGPKFRLTNKGLEGLMIEEDVKGDQANGNDKAKDGDWDAEMSDDEP